MNSCRRWLVVTIVVVFSGACGAGGSTPEAAGPSTTQSNVATTGATTSQQVTDPGPTTPAGTGSTQGGTTPTTSGRQATPSTTIPQTGSTTGGGGSRSITIAQLVADRASLVGQQVTVEGRVLFLLSCPPGGAGCTATGYLADRGTVSLPPSASAAQTQAILLAQSGNAVGCSGVTSETGLECAGFGHGIEYRISGTVTRLSNVVVLEVGAKQRL